MTAPAPKKHQPWKPDLSISTEPTGTAPATPEAPTHQHIPCNVADPVHEHDPSLEAVAASLIRRAGSRYSVSRQQRFVAKHLTPKAKAGKKAARRAQRLAHRRPASRPTNGNDTNTAR